MSLGTKIYTWLNGNLVGEDNKGNKYFCNSKDFKDIKAKGRGRGRGRGSIT